MDVLNESDSSYINLNSSCSEGEPSLRSCVGDVAIANSCLATVQLQCFGENNQTSVLVTRGKPDLPPNFVFWSI